MIKKKYTFNATTNMNTGAFYGSVSVDISFDLGRVHVRSMGEILIQAMIFANQRGEDFTEILVGVCITSINAAMLIVIFDSTGNCLQKWKKKVFFKKKNTTCKESFTNMQVIMASFYSSKLLIKGSNSVLPEWEIREMFYYSQVSIKQASLLNT